MRINDILNNIFGFDEEFNGDVPVPKHDAKIRIRAKRYLRKNLFTVDNDISNKMLIASVKLIKKKK